MPPVNAVPSKVISAPIRSIAFTLLFISVWINYIDRGTLGIAAPVLAPELHLSPDDMGRLLAAFSFTYAGAMILAGWLVDRFDVSWVYGIGLGIWSAATVATGYADTFVTLFCLRLILGASESVSFPAYSRILARAYPEHRRGLANALVDIGTKAGPALGTWVGGQIIAHSNWRTMFIVLGAVGLLWLPFWFASAPRVFVWPSETDSPRRPGGRMPSLLRLLEEHTVWATCFGLFCLNYGFYFLLSWLPSYLVSERHLSVATMSVYGALPFCATAVSSLTCGWFSDKLISGGRQPLAVRRTFCAVGLIVCGGLLPFVPMASNEAALAILMVAAFGMGIYSSNSWAITQTLAGPLAAGKWTGLQNGFANLAGIVAPIVTGRIVTQSGSFYSAFMVASALLLIGSSVYILWLRGARPIDWDE